MNQNRQKFLWLIPLLIFIGLAVLLWTRLGVDPKIVPQATTGKPFPTFSLPSLADGRLQTVADLPKQPFVLNVWGSWCPTCAVEHPYLMKIARQGVILVGVNYKDQPSAALAYLEKQGNPFSINLQDSTGDLGLDLGLTGAPETFIVDQHQQIRLHVIGEVDNSVWQTQLKPCLDSLKAGGGAGCQ